VTFADTLKEMLGASYRSIRLELDDFDAFRQDYSDPRPGINRQKLLEYFVSISLLDLTPEDVYMDVAAQDCPFAFYVADKVGCLAYRQDLHYMEPGVHGQDIGSDASAIPLADESVSKMSLHNSIEHFEGESDTRFMIEAERLLRPGGRLLITPLELETSYREEHEAGWIDDEGVKHTWGVGARFARHYDLTSLRDRLLSPAQSLAPTILELANMADFGPECYLRYILLLNKAS
jgi:SAM-dependent methyltransferase